MAKRRIVSKAEMADRIKAYKTQHPQLPRRKQAKPAPELTEAEVLRRAADSLTLKFQEAVAHAKSLYEARNALRKFADESEEHERLRAGSAEVLQ